MMYRRFPLAALTAGLLLTLISPLAAGPIPDPIVPGQLIVRLEPVADGLSAPNWGTFAPGLPARLLFVTDQDGEIWEFDLQTGASRIYLDVRARLVSLSPFQDERGLLGLAFHPEFTRNGRLYTYTSEPPGGNVDFPSVGATPDHHAVITEWRVPQPANPFRVPDPASARVVLRIAEP
ncbi:MAG: CHRD domain-containing protein, partial [Acidobacteriota bacterium]